MQLDEYLQVVSGQIRSGRARILAVKEMRDHIEDQAAVYEAEGMPRGKALEEAVRQMGDPVEAGVDLDRIHRPKMEWRLLAGIVAFSVLGLAVQYLCFYGPGVMAGSSMANFANQCVYTMMGLLVMAGICLWDYSMIGKYAEAFGLCFLGGIFLICHFLPVVNGGRGYLKCIMYLFVPVYGGILYKNRGRDLAGLGASALWIGAAFFVGTGSIGGGFSIIWDAVMTCGIMLLAAVWKEWFGISRRSGMAVVCVLGVCTAIVLAVNLAPYQVQRILTLFHPDENGAGYQIDGIRKVLSNLSMNRSAYGMLEQKGLLPFWNRPEIQSEYMLLQSAVALGMTKTGLLCICYGVFFFYLFRMVWREKNRLGQMTALGCTTVLAVETARNILYNLGIGLSSTAGIPFFSFGKIHTLTVYMLLGVLLSIYRYQNLVWDLPVKEQKDKRGVRIGNYVIRVEKRIEQ